MTIVPVGVDGHISIANYAGDAPVIVDVLAWFPANARFGALDARSADGHPGGLPDDRWPSRRLRAAWP